MLPCLLVPAHRCCMYGCRTAVTQPHHPQQREEVRGDSSRKIMASVQSPLQHSIIASWFLIAQHTLFNANNHLFMQRQETRQLKEHQSVVTSRPGGCQSSSRGTGNVKGCLHAKVSSLAAEQPLWLYWKIIPHFLVGLVSLSVWKKKKATLYVFFNTHTHTRKCLYVYSHIYI